MHNVFITNNIKESHWAEFLDKCNKATIYHTPQWKNLLEQTFGYKPYYLFAIDETDQMIGLLPLFYVKSRITGNRLCSLPFAHECGYIGDKDVLDNSLTDELMGLYNTLNLDTIEIRDHLDNNFYQSSDFSTYILELSPKVEDIWKKLDRGSVRWAVRKAEKSGVSVERSTNLSDLSSFYKLNSLTKRELGVPGHTRSFFQNLSTFLHDSLALYVARYEGEVIGGGIMIYYKDTVLYGYGAAHPKSLGMYPYNAFIWGAIKNAAQDGYRHFDFGRVSFDNIGLANFKKRWGTIENKLYYSSYPRPLSRDRANVRYKLAGQVVKKLPLPLYERFSDWAFPHFG